MQEIRIDNEQQTHPRAPGVTATGTSSSSSATASASSRIRQRTLNCYKCNKPDNKAVICSRDGPTRGGYCLNCFERYIGEFFRSGFLRQCGMLSFLQEQDRKLLARILEQNQQVLNETGANKNEDASATSASSSSLTPEQVLCPSTKFIVAVSGSYNSMSLLIQLATLAKEIGDKYKTITRQGAKLPPQGKNALVRPFELVVVHLTRFDHHQQQTSVDDSANDTLLEEMSAEESESFRVEEERMKTIRALANRLEIEDKNIIFEFVGKAASKSGSSLSASSSSSSSSAIELASKCFNSSASLHSQSNKALPLSVREDIYRCLVRNGLLFLAERKNAQVVVLAQSATSSSWAALNDITRGRGAGLFEANGYFCEIPVSSRVLAENTTKQLSADGTDDAAAVVNKSSSTNNTGKDTIKFIRPLVGTASRELTLFCTILNKNKFPEAQNCSVENPTSFSPAIPSIDRTLEDFVLNLTKSFASTSFNVAKSIEKVNAINFMRRIEGNEEAFMVATGSNSIDEDAKKQQEDILENTKNWKNCPLCIFSKVFDQSEEEKQDKNEDDDGEEKKNKKSSSAQLCHGCSDSLIEELDSLKRNLPAAGAKKQSGDFLDLLKKYMEENLI